jgi:hypothetical protein
VLSLMVAACIHDVDHPGYSNDFLVAASSELAILYNDQSPLENHHASTGFKILNKPANNFLNHLASAETKYFRRMVIQLVLQTDLKCHFPLLKSFQDKCSKEVGTEGGWDFSKFDDRLSVCGIAIKCADISHSSKEFDAHVAWSRRVIDEFFGQGEAEAKIGLPISPLCDKKIIDLAKSQMGFINFLCIPLFKVFTQFLGIKKVEDVIMSQLRYNESQWGAEQKLGTHFAGQSSIINNNRRKSQEERHFGDADRLRRDGGTSSVKDLGGLSGTPLNDEVKPKLVFRAQSSSDLSLRKSKCFAETSAPTNTSSVGEKGGSRVSSERQKDVALSDRQNDAGDLV